MGASEEFQAEALWRCFERKASQIILISPARTERAQALSLASPALDSSPQNAKRGKGRGQESGPASTQAERIWEECLHLLFVQFLHLK